MTRLNYLFLILISLTLCSSCGVYSFSGATIPPEVKSVSIDYIMNKAPNSWSSLDRIFNVELKQKMIKDAGLKILDREGDYKIQGYLSSYTITPQAPTTGQFTNSYKLSITVFIQFTDTKTEKKVSWEKNFSNFEVYSDDISGKEDELIKKISQNISNQIFNDLFSTW